MNGVKKQETFLGIREASVHKEYEETGEGSMYGGFEKGERSALERFLGMFLKCRT